MSATANQEGSKTLAQIEASLNEAETAYKDADERLSKARADRDRALDIINSCQAAFDDAIANIRKRGIPGSRWREASPKEEDALILNPGDGNDKVSSMSQAKVATVSAEFKRLKDVARVNSNDPLLKVAIGRNPRD